MGAKSQSKQRLVPAGIQRLLAMAAKDSSFRRRLSDGPLHAAQEVGAELTSRERMILAALSGDQLAAMSAGLSRSTPRSRRAFLRRSAQAAAALLGGAALVETAACTGCTPMATGGGAAPDMPPPTTDEDEPTTGEQADGGAGQQDQTTPEADAAATETEADPSSAEP